jgi:MinD superfamily P-loop ATPase
MNHILVILGGMGGIGKTQLAIIYTRYYSGSYESIFRLNTASEATMKTSLRSMAERLIEAAEYEKLEDKRHPSCYSKFCLSTVLLPINSASFDITRQYRCGTVIFLSAKSKVALIIFRLELDLNFQYLSIDVDIPMNK